MPPPLTTALLAQACRIFLAAAYPDGPQSIPAAKAAYAKLTGDEPLEACVAAGGPVCQTLRGGGFALRLGSAHYPHLKLAVQPIARDDVGAWVFSVDTHDFFKRGQAQPEPDDPDAAAWRQLQAANRALKERIEAAWEAAGLLTLNALLRGALPKLPGARADALHCNPA